LQGGRPERPGLLFLKLLQNEQKPEERKPFFVRIFSVI
jgi:hypothetical protein